MKATEAFLPDGISSPYRVLNIETDFRTGLPVTTQAREPDLNTYYDNDYLAPIIFANGYGEDVDTLMPLASNLIARAERNGHYQRITIHDSPKTYSFNNRAERFRQVVSHVSADGDLPVRLVGHSLGFPQTLTVAEDILSEGGRVASLTGISPNGLTPAPVAATATLNTLSWHSVKEALQLPLHATNPAALRLGVNILSHTLRHPGQAITEGTGILTHNYAEQAVTIHGKLAAEGNSRMTILAGTKDGVCPSEPMRKNLVDAGFPNFDIMDYAMNHGDPLLNPTWSGPIYDAILLRRNEAAII